MMSLKNLLILTALSFPINSFAISQAAYNGKINNAIGSIIESKAKKAGFAANDPRITDTVTTVSTQLTGLGTSMVVGGVTAAIGGITWPVILAGVGIAGATYVISEALQLGVTSAINWAYGDGDNKQKIMVTGTGLGSYDIKLLPVMPSTYVEIANKYSPDNDIWFQDSGKARQIRFIQVPCQITNVFCNGSNPSTQQIDYTFTANTAGPYPGANGYWNNVFRRIISTGPLVPGGPNVNTVQILYEFKAPTSTTLQPPLSTSDYKTVPQALTAIPQTMGTEALSDEMLADLVNRAWSQSMASATPSGPATPDNGSTGFIPPLKVTPSDIAQWRLYNPTLVPTVQDFATPVAPLGENEVFIPRTQSGQDASPNPSTPTQSTNTDVKIDFGTFTPPSLEPTPTTEQILDPIFNFFPQWTHFQIPPHSSSCPTSMINLQLHGYQLLDGDLMGRMCEMFETYKPTIRALEILGWSFAAAIIVFKA